MPLPQASKLKQTYFATRKILQNFEYHDHWHCRHIYFSVFVGKIMAGKYGRFHMYGRYQGHKQ